MASIYQLKPAFQNLIRPIVRSFARAGITANAVTIGACALSFGMGGLIWALPESKALLLAVPPFMLFRMGLNAIDGLLAREHGMKSRLGGILNELTDVLADGALYLPFAAIPGVDARLIVGIVFLGAVSEFAGVVAVTVGSERRYDGPMGKSDRAFAFGLVAFLLGLGVAPGLWLDALLGAVLALLALTIVNRSRSALAAGGPDKPSKENT